MKADRERLGRTTVGKELSGLALTAEGSRCFWADEEGSLEQVDFLARFTVELYEATLSLTLHGAQSMPDLSLVLQVPKVT